MSEDDQFHFTSGIIFFKKNSNDLARINREIIEKWDNEKGFDSKLAKKIELLSKIN